MMQSNSWSLVYPKWFGLLNSQIFVRNLIAIDTFLKKLYVLLYKLHLNINSLCIMSRNNIHDSCASSTKNKVKD